ncbi:MAG: FixH family protein [Bdellovibrio bacteriovorus]
MQTTSSEAKTTSAWRSPWVIGWIGLVVTVLGVNLTMVVLAVATNPGLVNDDFYERGQDYERTLMSRRARDPGWTIKADFPSDIKSGEPTTVRVFLVDRAGQPVSPGAVTFFAYRPSDKSLDFSAPMMEEGKGRYVAQVSFPAFGLWDGLVAVGQGGDEYTTSARIAVARP